MQKKLIIFDMDGTLVNSSITIANAINYVRKNLGFQPMEEEDILSKVNDHSMNPAQVFYHAKSFDSDHEKWFSDYYSKYHKEELVLYDGIKPLLFALKEKGYTLAVATNAHRNSTLKSLGHLEVMSLFDGIVCHDDVAQSKPQPDMLFKLLNDLDISAEEALFIGDGSRDEMASKSANIDYIMVDWGFSDHDYALRSVEELSQYLLKI
ncbi:Predicted phosphatase [hydrothermal vent metagenome]|uniref:Predicted phosphatase n=1 Tax=hydrothermal vent metagenome TaxID=652676 RepID=A0A1W1CAW4_9ZZZZ